MKGNSGMQECLKLNAVVELCYTDEVLATQGTMP